MYLNRFLENRCSYVRHILKDALSTKFEELFRCHVKKMLTYLRKMFAGNTVTIILTISDVFYLFLLLCVAYFIFYFGFGWIFLGGGGWVAPLKLIKIYSICIFIYIEMLKSGLFIA